MQGHGGPASLQPRPELHAPQRHRAHTPRPPRRRTLRQPVGDGTSDPPGSTRDERDTGVGAHYVVPACLRPPPAHSAAPAARDAPRCRSTRFRRGRSPRERRRPDRCGSSAAGAPAGPPAAGARRGAWPAPAPPSSTSEAGTARFTSPRRWASAPLTRSPRSRCSLAADRLVSSGQSTNPPAPSRSPSETRGSLRNVSSAITTRSHSSATVTPAPTAAPLTAATVGNGSASHHPEQLLMGVQHSVAQSAVIAHRANGGRSPRRR